MYILVSVLEMQRENCISNIDNGICHASLKICCLKVLDFGSRIFVLAFNSLSPISPYKFSRQMSMLIF